jgi:hypothetical protein
MQALKFEGKDLAGEQNVAEILNEYFVAIAVNVNRQINVSLLVTITIIRAVRPMSWNKPLTKLTKVWNVNTKQQKK